MEGKKDLFLTQTRWKIKQMENLYVLNFYIFQNISKSVIVEVNFIYTCSAWEINSNLNNYKYTKWYNA